MEMLQKKSDNFAAKFTGPEPAKPAQPVPETVWIRYPISKKEFDIVKEYLEMDKSGDIGRRTFDYFFAREIEG